MVLCSNSIRKGSVRHFRNGTDPETLEILADTKSRKLVFKSRSRFYLSKAVINV